MPLRGLYCGIGCVHSMQAQPFAELQNLVLQSTNLTVRVVFRHLKPVE
jgi:hypothetical protein